MIFGLSPIDYALSLLVISIGTLLQGSVGFGLGLLSVPILLLIEPTFIPGPLLLIAFFLNILMFMRERESIDLKGLKWTIPGRLIGTIIGASILTFVPEDIIGLLFGSLILLAVVLSVSGLQLPFTPRNQLGVGTLSGFMATTTAVGGPPLALLYQNASGKRLRGTLSAIFLIGTFFAILSLILIKKLGLNEVVLSLGALPAVVVGFYLSGKTTQYLDRGFIRPAVLIISTASALVVIIKYLI